MTARVDLFTLVHKGLRWWFGIVSAALGSTDFAGPEAPAALDAADELLRQLDNHAHHEDTFILPLVRDRLPARAVTWEASHRELEAAQTALRARVAALRSPGPSPEEARSEGLALYRAFNRFAADMFGHLDEEETQIMPLLWSTCSDADLASVMQHFIASCGADAAAFHRRVSSAYAPAERKLLGL